MDNNTTILVPLKDRGDFTLRFLGWYNLVSCPFRFVIADGGGCPTIKSILRDKSNFPNIKYDYIEYPYDETLTEYHAKMSDIVDKIETPLTLLMDNDDFFYVGAIYMHTKFLFHSKDYSSSRGALNKIFMLPPGHQKGDIIEAPVVYGDIILTDNMYSKYRAPILGETAEERLRDQSARFHGNWHNLTRTRHMKAACKLVGLANPSNFRFTEQYLGFMNALWGKCNRADGNFILHQDGTPRSTETNHFPPQEEWINQEYWIDSFSKMTSVIASVVSYYDDTDVKEAEEVFRQAYLTKLPDHRDLLLSKYEECKKADNSSLIKRCYDVLDDCKVKEIEPLHPFEYGDSCQQEYDLLERVLREYA